jgi:GxxExxY protein
MLRITPSGHSALTSATIASPLQELEYCYQNDIFVDDAPILEIKSVDHINPVHETQLLTCVRLSRIPVGLLLNFNAPILKDGIRRRRV